MFTSTPTRPRTPDPLSNQHPTDRNRVKDNCIPLTFGKWIALSIGTVDNALKSFASCPEYTADWV